jgi:DNA-binding response OmpR family regulator
LWLTSPRSSPLLRFLMQHPDRIFSREEVIEEIWGAAADVEPRTRGRPRAALA